MIDLDVNGGIDLWDLISSGSASIDIKHGENVLTVNTNLDKIVFDIWDLYKVKVIVKSLTGLLKWIGYTDILFQSTYNEKGYMDMLNQIGNIAKILNKRGKTAIIKYQGREIVKIGKGAQSLTLGLLGIKYVQITRKMMALKLMAIFREIPLKI